jgi:thioredoxin 1
MTSTPLNLTSNEVEALVLDSKLPLVVDFWAAWCGPCRMLAPILERLASELDGRVTIAKLDVDENPEATLQYGVEGIPTLIVFADGKEVGRIVGFAHRDQILSQLQSLLPRVVEKPALATR